MRMHMCMTNKQKWKLKDTQAFWTTLVSEKDEDKSPGDIEVSNNGMKNCSQEGISLGLKWILPTRQQ